jgi:DNA-nicking Smr family endonuclease
MKRKPPSLDKPYPKHRHVSEDEAQLWQETLGERPESSPPAEKRKEHHGERGEASRGTLHSAPNDSKPAAKSIVYPQPMDARTRTKIARGRLAVEATLDLHGFTKSAAHAELKRFIEAAQARGVRLALVITGKGREGKPGALREELPRWLGESPLQGRIIAYDAAGPRHGGKGAWYVRIRKRKPDDGKASHSRRR